MLQYWKDGGFWLTSRSVLGLIAQVGTPFLGIEEVFMGHYRKYCYTVEDVSVLSLVPVKTVRRHITEGRLDMHDLMSVLRYVFSRRIDCGEKI